MARVKLSSLVSSMDGKLSGSALHTSKGSTYLRNKAYPKQANSQKRLKHLSDFSTIKNIWSSLSLESKEQWGLVAKQFPISDKNGDSSFLTAYNYFQKVNLKLMSFGNQTIESYAAAESPGASIGLKVLELNVLNNSNGYYFDSIILEIEALTAIPSNSIVFISISNAQKTANKKNWSNMNPLISFEIQKEVNQGVKFQVAIPVPNLPSNFFVAPGYLYRFELSFLDKNSLGFTVLSSVQAFSTLQILADYNFSNFYFMPDPFSNTFITGDSISGYGWYFGGNPPDFNTSRYSLQPFSGYLTAIDENPLVLKSPYFGTGEKQILSITVVGLGYSSASRLAVAASMQDFPIVYIDNSSLYRHSKLTRVFDEDTGLFSKFFNYNSEIS